MTQYPTPYGGLNMYILKLYIIDKLQLMNQTRSLAYTPMMLTPLQVEINQSG